MQLKELADAHTHHTGRSHALLSLAPSEALAGCNTPYSISLHPWHLNEGNPLALFQQAIEQKRNDSLFLAIGECGLDNQCQTPLAKQLDAFRMSLHMAHRFNKPVIIHCVGCWNEVIREVTDQFGKPTPSGAAFQPTCLIHGFRKGPQLAQQLLKAGFCLSLGEKFNPEVARLIPEDRLFIETDESQEDIWKIREKIVNLRAE